MKFLVIDLLRIGDFLMTLPVLHGLKNRWPASKIDVLTFSPVQQLQPLLPVVQDWWTLDRDELQHGLGRKDVPLLTSFDVLKEQLDTINGQNYDVVINLSQTFFSAWVAGYIHSCVRSGLFFSEKGEAQIHSPWFQYLNDETQDSFHYSDIYYYGAGLTGGVRQWTLEESAVGRAEAQAFRAQNTVVVQARTSAAKKTWPEDSWVQMLVALQKLQPQIEILMLGSPVESQAIGALQKRLQASGVQAKQAIVSLAGAYSILRQAQLLLTGDTSIKHLAVAAGTPVVELSLGSSDPRRTGVYRQDALILQPTVGCSPCSHSAPCSQSQQVCAQDLKPETVALSAHHYMAGNWSTLRALADSCAGEVQLLRTLHHPIGFWYAQNIRANKNCVDHAPSKLNLRSRNERIGNQAKARH